MTEPEKEHTRSANARESDDAWGALSLVISGITLWGGAGFLLGLWLDSQVPVVLGLLLGMAGALYLVWVRYGRS
jgi:ATP synthase protein I